MVTKRIGLVIVGVAIFWAGWESWIMLHWPVGQALRTPIALKPGQFRSPEFSVPVSYPHYVIEIELDPAIAPGGTQSEDIDLSWRLVANGELCRSGSSTPPIGISSLGRMVGSFPLSAGTRYALLLDIHRDGGELNSANPRLVVKISPGDYGEFLGPPLAMFAAALLAGVGFLVIWVGHRNSREPKR